MHPVLFSVFGFPIYSWGVFLVLGLVAATLYSIKAGPHYGIDKEKVLDAVIWVCIGSIICARITYVILNWNLFTDNVVSVFFLRDGGLSFIGGLIGGVIAGYFYFKSVKIRFAVAADFASPAIALGYAVARIGCLLNGCCYGVVSDVPWAINCSSDGLLRHPTQIYSVISGLIMFVVLITYKKRRKSPGQVFALFGMMYAIYRFIVEFFRVDYPDIFYPFTITQVFCILMFVAGLLFFLVLRSKPLEEKNISFSNADDLNKSTVTDGEDTNTDGNPTMKNQKTDERDKK